MDSGYEFLQCTDAKGKKPIVAYKLDTENLEKQMKALQTQLQALKQEQAELLGKTTPRQKKTGAGTKTTSVSTPSNQQKQGKVFANNPGGAPGSQTDSETYVAFARIGTPSCG